MKKHVTTLAFLTLTLAFPVAMSAQICYGAPSLGTNSAGNVGAGVSFFDGGKGYGAGASFGRSLFGAASFNFTDFDDTSLSFKTLSGGIGYAASPEGTTISVCPAFSISYGFGLEVFGVDFTTTSFAPSLSIGLETEVSPSVTVAPFAQAFLMHSRFKADAGIGGEVTETDTDGGLILGLGLIFNGRFSVGPSVFIPIGAEEGDTSFGVGFSVALGESRQ